MSAAQNKRLQEILLQMEGTPAFEEASVQAALKLTDKQKQAIDDALLQSTFKRVEIWREFGHQSAETDRKERELDQATWKQLLGLLDIAQKKQWHEMIGKPFQP